MNIAARGDQLHRQLAARLEEILATISWLRGRVASGIPQRDDGWDIEAELSLPSGSHARVLVECKYELRPSQFAVLANRFRPGAQEGEVTVPVLAAPHISPRLAAVAQQHGWSWFDLAGNCRLDVPGLLHIERTGNPAPYRRPRPAANLSSPEAARVMRALLAPQHAGRVWTQRELQAECSPTVSLGLVNKLVRHLRDEAFLGEASERGVRLRDPEGALGAWAGGYRQERSRREGYFTLLQGRKLADALSRLDVEAQGRAILASFSAAEFQAPHVRQPRTWLYLTDDAVDAFRSLLETKPVDSGANLIVLFPEDAGVFYLPDRAPGRLAATNPVQTYVDLLHSGGRGEEAAEAVLEQRLRPMWRSEQAR